jgi:hypothetical protein
MFDNLEDSEFSVYSQNGEDGVLKRLSELIGTTNQYFVEFGTGAEGTQRNTRLLEENGWTGLLMDVCARADHPRIRKERVTAENINSLFAKHGVPEEFDLLSIDIDGNDYWVWKAIDARYRPRVLVMEYNAVVPPTEARTIQYDPNFMWSGTDYFGASLLALDRISKAKGYALVYCELRGINAFWVRSDLAPGAGKSVEQAFREPDYARGKFFGLARLYWPRGAGHRKDKRRSLVPV